MKKIGIIVAAFLIVGFSSNAQNKTANSLSYKTSAGIKIWDGAGISLKTFIDPKNAVEFIGFFNGNGTRISGLYEIHGDLNTESNLKWYFGPGAHIGLYHSLTYFGLDGVIGMDYKFKNQPINLSLDWQPSFEFGSGAGFAANYGGLGIRYTF